MFQKRRLLKAQKILGVQATTCSVRSRPVPVTDSNHHVETGCMSTDLARHSISWICYLGGSRCMYDKVGYSVIARAIVGCTSWKLGRWLLAPLMLSNIRRSPVFFLSLVKPSYMQINCGGCKMEPFIYPDLTSANLIDFSDRSNAFTSEKGQYEQSLYVLRM